jgi:hypothetical protein
MHHHGESHRPVKRHNSLLCTHHRHCNHQLVKMTSHALHSAKQHTTAGQALVAKPGVSSKLMDFTNVSASTMAISLRNQQQPPLLAFPDEILESIFKEVVANKVVHVLPKGRKGSRKFKAHVCLSSDDCPDSKSPRIIVDTENCTVDDCTDYNSCFTTRHDACSTDTSAVNAKDGLNLDFLRTCRGIFQQGFLLPFKDNEFVFGMHAPIEGPAPTMTGFVSRFLNRMANKQREAIRHVTVVSNTCQPSDKLQLARLRGTRSLHMLLAPGNNPVDLYTLIEGTWNFASDYPFQLLSLESFRFTMEVYLSNKDCAIISSQIPTLKRLIQKMETRFLRWNSQSAKIKTVSVVKKEKDDADRDELRKCLTKLDKQRLYEQLGWRVLDNQQSSDVELISVLDSIQP